MMIPPRTLLRHGRLGLLTSPKTTLCAISTNSILCTTPSSLNTRMNSTFQLSIRQYSTRHRLSTALHPLQSPNHSKTYSTITTSTLSPIPQPQFILPLEKSQLPPICPGCGASSQIKHPGLPGYYDLERARRKVVTMSEKKTDKPAKWEESKAWEMNLERLKAVMKELERERERDEKEGVQDKKGEVEGGEFKKVESFKGRGKSGEVKRKKVDVNTAPLEVDEVIILKPESSPTAERVVRATEGQNSSIPKSSDIQSVQINQGESTTVPLEKILSKSKSLEEMEFLDEDGEQLGLDGEKFDFKTTDTPMKTSPPPDATQRPKEDTTTPIPSSEPLSTIPICERCKSLIHQYTATPLPAYPDLDSLRGLIAESNYEKHHIYHLIDAVDFPLSLIPRLRSYLAEYLPSAKAKRLTISYIVTRADLIMPKAEQVTSLMTYLKNTLKHALPDGESIESHFSSRGGVFRVLSAKNGWSVNKIKSEFSELAGLKLPKTERGKIKNREGAIWIVGKVNVGKSRFVGEIVPKGSYTKLQRVVECVSGPRATYKFEEATNEGEKNMKAMLARVEREEREKNPNATKETLDKVLEEAKNQLRKQTVVEEELPFVSPVVSYFSGTTVAPLRVVFRGPSEKNQKGPVKGEIIDLPGMERGRFLDFVRPELRRKVPMEYRVDPAEYVVRPGQALLLAGLILIEPKTPDTDFLMYPYSNLPPHVTNTEKALKLMNHPNPANFPKPILYQHAPGRNILMQSTSANNNDITVTKGENRATGKELDTPAGGQAGVSKGEEVNEDADTSLTWKDDAIPASLPSQIQSAGIYKLSHNVTRLRNPNLKGISDLQLELMPYKIYSTDILLEGIGWVEIVAQIRSKLTMHDIVPEVEVFSPLGKSIGSRAPMGADMLRMAGLKEIGKYNIRRKPTRGKKRPSMKGRKKEARRRFREATGQRW